MWCIGSLFLLVWTYSEAMVWRLITIVLIVVCNFSCVALLLFGVYYWYHYAFEVLVKYAMLLLLQIKKNYIEYCWGYAHDSRHCWTLLVEILLWLFAFYFTPGSCVKCLVRFSWVNKLVFLIYYLSPFYLDLISFYLILFPF